AARSFEHAHPQQVPMRQWEISHSGILVTTELHSRHIVAVSGTHRIRATRKVISLQALGIFGLGVAALLAGAGAALPQGTPPPAAVAPADAPPAALPAPAQNPVCVRLESQLAVVNRGITDPGRAEQIARYEEAARKQQAELDRMLAQ